MKKVIFGGFCMICGVLLFFFGINPDSPIWGVFLLEYIPMLGGLAMFIAGLTLGIRGLREQ